MSARVKRIMLILIIPVVYAILLRLCFGVESWSELYEVMSYSFLFFVPTIVGILTMYSSPKDRVRSLAYRIFTPWIPVFLFFVLTVLTNIEGWACWIMILPVFLFAATLGGLIGGHWILRKPSDKMKISLVVLLPLLLGPIESYIGSIPAEYEAYTYIDIEAPADVIWGHVTRVQTIPEDQDTGWLTNFLGFPRPVRAELDFEGVGAYREAIFTGGLVFHESVTEYEVNVKMVFDIKAYPHEIPAATMDEHVVIGGKYFDVLNGTYELEALDAGIYRLHLTSRFEMNTTFNFYAGWWGKMIMEDIQDNILRVEKNRAEKYYAE